MICTWDSHIQKAQISAHKYIAQRAQFAYTTLRTVSQNRVLKLSQHIQRLYTALRTHLQGKFTESLQQLHDRVISHIRYILANQQDVHSELRIYLLIDYETQHISSYTELLTIPPPVSTFRTVQLERENPSVKDDAWIHSRQQAERLINNACNEVIMYNHKQIVTEGLSSNVFIVDNQNILLTAPRDLVLEGTMRSVVLEAAVLEGMTVEERPFTLGELQRAKEVFVCSTSRIIVCGMSVDGRSKTTQIGMKLRERVQQIIESASEPVE